MATALKIITRAAQLIGLVESGESLEASEVSDGLDSLNQMLHAWADQGIDLEHADLAQGDTLAVQDNHLAAIRYNLAIEMAAEYNRPIPAVVAMKADEYMRSLQAFYADPAKLGCDAALNPYFNPNTGHTG